MLSPKTLRCVRLTKPFLPISVGTITRIWRRRWSNIKNGNRAAFEKLLTHLQQNIEVVAQCKTSANEDEQLLYKEIEPWVLKLQTMVTAAQQFVEAQKQSSVNDGLGIFCARHEKTMLLSKLTSVLTLPHWKDWDMT